MIGRLLSIMPTGLLTKAAIYALVFVLGAALGNHWATERALQRELQASADRQRENHQQLIGWYAEKMKELRLAREQQADADAAAYAALQKGRAEAEQAAQRARSSLRTALNENQSLKEANDALKAIPRDPGCIMPPGVRQSINNYIASINSAPAIGNPISPSTGMALGPPAADSVLSCRELASSVIDILNHDAAMIAEIMSWRAWSAEALK